MSRGMCHSKIILLLQPVKDYDRNCNKKLWGMKMKNIQDM